MTRNEAPATTSPYRLAESAERPHIRVGASLRRLAPFTVAEGRQIAIAFAAALVTSVSGLMAPFVISRAIDTYIRSRNESGLLMLAAALMAVYLVGLVAMYIQTLAMGGVGRRVLFSLRNALFAKLQELPLDFFNQNKAGDLISRVNSDTDKLNQFFAQGLAQLAGNLFMMGGTAAFFLILHPRLGAAALAPAACAFLITRAISPWVTRTNARGLQSLGGMSAEIQESLSHFKVVVAFGRRDYFRQRFDDANRRNFDASTRSGLASNVFMPIYGLAYNLAQVIVLVYGVSLIATDSLTVGLLIGFLLYVNNFYLPMRQFAAVWATFQIALAALDRISAVLDLETNLPVLQAGLPDEPLPRSPGASTRERVAASPTTVLAFEHVAFHYPGGRDGLHDVLRDVTFSLEPGKTYALVGPTGGGKTTTASLMARLYDPTHGTVFLDGRDIRSYAPAERARKIGFITQEPFLFTGTIRDNILYGDERYAQASTDILDERLARTGLSALLSRFPNGLDTKVAASGDAVSLGEKQIIAFIRAVLREPEILILDEATANIDTATEQVLQHILDTLPPTTTRVVVAHRLNTIANADEIFFVNATTVTPAGSMEHAVDMLLHGRRAS
jgi:ATP-binding cassette, subfamily B, bacterial